MNKATKTMMLTFTLAAAWALQSLAAVASLPSGYTRLEWIASTSDTPWIDTNYTPDQTDKISVRFRQSNDTSSDYQALFVARSGGKQTFSCLLLKNGTVRLDYNDSTHGWTPALTRLAEFILVAEGGISTQSYTVNGTPVSNYTSKGGEFTVGGPLRLFASETGGIPGRFRIYWFRVEDKNGVAKVDLRPCINPQGEIGMYDLVRETFCGNGGTGVFEINEVCLPSGYSACKWIESCGTQWINTQFTPTCLDSATMNFRFRSLSNEYIGLFCARKNGSTANCRKSVLMGRGDPA